MTERAVTMRFTKWVDLSQVFAYQVVTSLARELTEEEFGKGWSVRTLRERMDSMLYERTSISRQPEQTIKADLALLKGEGKPTPELVSRDPNFLDFLGLRDTFSENDLESAILTELQRFIIDLGTDFAFLAHQKRITVDNDDYYISFLFYHRRLRHLIVIDLKLVELLELGKSGIHVAEYLTELPPRKLLEQKLLSAIQTARLRLETDREAGHE
jgi:predicted nuclease of restriction endonuclease-like (RecB) superfamily